jgi:hypothetical protein
MLLIGGFFALLAVAFGADDPANRRRAQTLVTIATAAYAASAVGSYWLLSHRSGAWMAIAGLVVAVSHLPVIAGAIAILYRGK